MTKQQIDLLLGILKLQETYKTLKELNFSDCVLNEINDIVDDLKRLVENKEIEEMLDIIDDYLDKGKEIK